MESLAGVVARIRSIEHRVQPTMPPAGFHEALVRTAADPAAGARVTASATTTRDTAGRPALTLAQMLGRPVSPERALGPGPVGTPPGPGTATPSGWHRPVDAPMSSPFGPRVHPITGQSRLHAGIDLAAPTGTPIEAAAAGTVTFAGPRGGYGNLVIVDHGDGTETRYAHQDSISVRTGQQVPAGAVLGTVGSTGMSTGPHLHFELRRNGEPVDPAPLLGL